MKKILIFICLMLLFGISVSADTYDSYDTYRQQYEQSGVDEIKEALDDKTRKFLEENDLEPSDPEWVNKITTENVISHILEFLSNGMEKPLKATASIIGIILINACITSFGLNNERFEPAVYAATLAITAIIASDIWSSVSATVGAIKGCGTFMLSFVPIFASVAVLSGASATSASMSALLLTAAEGITAVAAHGILPLMGGYLAVSIASGVSPLIGQSGIAESIKKLSLWIMSLFSTLFVGILGLQTAVNASADSFALKTAKFILGTSVPVAGTALSEAITTISASVGLLRSSVGIYGVLAISVLMLPVILELIIWRIIMLLTGFISDFFSMPKISGLIKALDSMLAVLLGIALLTCGMFVIALTVTVTIGKG